MDLKEWTKTKDDGGDPCHEEFEIVYDWWKKWKMPWGHSPWLDPADFQTLALALHHDLISQEMILE